MSEMGNEFSGLPMDQLIGAPLRAACDAQVMLAKASADFINNVGFTREITKDATGKDIEKLVPRQVEFSFWQPKPITSKDKTTDKTTDDGSGISDVQKVVLSVPFLSIVNVPSLMVKTVNVTFDMEVKSSESHKDDSSQEAGFEGSAKYNAGLFSCEVKVHGSVSSHQENTRSTDRSAKYHVDVQARDDGMPEGLARVLDMLQKSIAPVSISQPISADKAKIIQNQAALPAP
jgi:hypothetical protein